MKTLYVADLDGTLLAGGKKLSDYTVKTINSLISYGLPFTVNTSRTYESAKDILCELKLNLPAILMNGSCFCNIALGKQTDQNFIPAYICRNVVAVIKSFGVCPFLFNYENGDVWVSHLKPAHKNEKCFMSARVNYYNGFREGSYITVTNSVPYIICVGDFDVLQKLKDRLKDIKGIKVCLYNTQNGAYMEITAHNSGKSCGAKRLMEKYSFDRLVAFGDNVNDIDFIKSADYGISVGNGVKELKAVADQIIGECKDDAVANYLMLEWSRDLNML